MVFRGRTYNSVFDMLDDIREAYQIEKRKRPAENNPSKPLTDFVEMSDEIREIYVTVPQAGMDCSRAYTAGGLLQYMS